MPKKPADQTQVRGSERMGQQIAQRQRMLTLQKDAQVLGRGQLEEELPAMSARSGGNGKTNQSLLPVTRGVDHRGLLGMYRLAQGSRLELEVRPEIQRAGLTLGDRSHLKA